MLEFSIILLTYTALIAAVGLEYLKPESSTGVKLALITLVGVGLIGMLAMAGVKGDILKPLVELLSK